MYQKIWEVGLKIQYNNAEDETIRVQTHMIAALTFAPTDKVPRVFCLLLDEVDDKLLPIVKYFGKTYVIGWPAWGRRKAFARRYFLALWNHNLSEVLHNRFNISV